MEMGGGGGELAVGIKGLNHVCVCARGWGHVLCCSLSLSWHSTVTPPLYNLHPCVPAVPGLCSGIPLSL